MLRCAIVQWCNCRHVRIIRDRCGFNFANVSLKRDVLLCDVMALQEECMDGGLNGEPTRFKDEATAPV